MDQVNETINQAADRASEVYDDIAKHYDEFVGRSKYFSLKWIAEHLDELKGLPECRVLDLGCGTGLNVKVLSEKWPGIRADGIDVSDQMIEHARSTGKYESLYRHDLNKPLSDFESNAFDLVIAFGVLELLSDLLACLSECRRVLKINGKLWAAFRRFEAGDEASPPRQISWDGMTITGYSAGQIVHLMKTLDLRITGLDTVVAYTTGSGFVYPYYVVIAQKI